MNDLLNTIKSIAIGYSILYIIGNIIGLLFIYKVYKFIFKKEEVSKKTIYDKMFGK